MIFAPKPPIAEKNTQSAAPQAPVAQEAVEQPTVPITQASVKEAPVAETPTIETPVAETPVQAEQAPVQMPAAESVEVSGNTEPGLSGINPSDTAGMGYHGQTDTSYMDDGATATNTDSSTQETQPVKEPVQQQTKHIDDVWFSDLYFTPEKIAYIRDPHTQFALMPFESEDLMDFHKALEEGFQGASSYAIHYGK